MGLVMNFEGGEVTETHMPDEDAKVVEQTMTDKRTVTRAEMPQVAEQARLMAGGAYGPVSREQEMRLVMFADAVEAAYEQGIEEIVMGTVDPRSVA